MISPLSDLKTINQVRFFNINSQDIDSLEICRVLGPLESILQSHEHNSIYVFRDGQTIHAEALIQTKYGLSKSQSVGTTLKESLEKLVPVTLRNTTKRQDHKGCLKLVG